MYLTNNEFQLNLLAELHGLIFDIVVIVFILGSLDKYQSFRESYSYDIKDIRALLRQDNPSNKQQIQRILHRIAKRKHHGLIFIFSGKRLDGMDFSGLNLSGSEFKNSSLTHCNFKKANLSKCIFENADVSNADFQKSNLKNANFKEAAAENTNFKGAKKKNVLNLND
jgi:uncharacterized protein YjbI with pentapeptide repeats